MEYIIGIDKITESLGVNQQHLACLRRNNKEVKLLLEKYFEEKGNRPHYRVKVDNVARLKDIIDLQDRYFVGSIKSINKRLGIKGVTTLYSILEDLGISYEVVKECENYKTILKLEKRSLECCIDYVNNGGVNNE